MLPMMCDQLPCMNIAVRIVTQSRPATMLAGMTDQRVTKGSPPASSSTNTRALTPMMIAVTKGNCVGRREASVRGINIMGIPSYLGPLGRRPSKDSPRDPSMSDFVPALDEHAPLAESADEQHLTERGRAPDGHQQRAA